MVYFKDHEKTVEDGTVLSWIMQGHSDRPEGKANLRFTLQVRFVRNQYGRRGIVLDQAQTDVPDEIKLTALQPNDMDMYKGQVVWLAGYNGMVVEFEGDLYLLFQVLMLGFEEGVGGWIYFHSFLPEQFGGGDIVYSERQFLE